jgi:hypothetical protein
MSHGLWTKEELQAVKSDKWLATQLMNEITLDSKMASAYPYKQRRTYIVDWYENESEPITIYATDEKMLREYIASQYTTEPDYIAQKITQYRIIQNNL